LESISKLTNLRKLSLNWNPGLTNSGIKSVGRLHNLESLDVVNCGKITNECLVHLRSLKHLTELKGFDFNPVFPKGKMPMPKS
jgi:hypothetical protein